MSKSVLDRFDGGFVNFPEGTSEIPPTGSKIRILQKQLKEMTVWARYAKDSNEELSQQLASVTEERDDLRRVYGQLSDKVRQLEDDMVVLGKK